MTPLGAGKRLVIFLDRNDQPLSGSVEWFSEDGTAIESLVTHAGPFDLVDEFIHLLMDQKMRSHLDITWGSVR